MVRIKLSRLLSQLRQQRIDPRDVVVYVDDGLLDSGYGHKPWSYSIPEENEQLYEDDDEVEDD